MYFISYYNKLPLLLVLPYFTNNPSRTSTNPLMLPKFRQPIVIGPTLVTPVQLPAGVLPRVQPQVPIAHKRLRANVALKRRDPEVHHLFVPLAISGVFVALFAAVLPARIQLLGGVYVFEVGLQQLEHVEPAAALLTLEGAFLLVL